MMQIMNENPLYSCLGNRLFVLAQIKTFCHVELIFMFSGAAPPPAPPTRTSSFVPKGVEPAAVLRPDRPPPPTSVKRGHSRNQSTGNILFAGGNLAQTSSPHLRSRTSSVKDNTFHLQREPIPAWVSFIKPSFPVFMHVIT